MPRWLVITLVLVAGVAVIVALGFVFAGTGEEVPEDAGLTQPEQTVTEETPTEPEDTPTEPEETTPAEEQPPPPPEIATLRVRVQDGRPQGGIQRLTVRRGERVRVRVRADVADHVHVHGYDLMADVGPGRPAEIRFRAAVAGRFEIELEDRHLLIAELEVRP